MSLLTELIPKGRGRVAGLLPAGERVKLIFEHKSRRAMHLNPEATKRISLYR